MDEKPKKPSGPEFAKMLIDGFTEEEKKEFAVLISKDVKVPKIRNKLELQVG